MPFRCRGILRFVVRILLIATDICSGWIFKLINWRKQQSIAPIGNLILLESATSLAEQIRNRKIRSEDVVKIYINRINEVNEILNAVVDTRYEDAIREAQEVDQFLASGQKSTEEIATEKPLLGVPFTIKECISTKGKADSMHHVSDSYMQNILHQAPFSRVLMEPDPWALKLTEISACIGLHHSAGLLVRQNIIAKEDASAVTLLKNAGAIVLGVTNVPEIGLWWDCYNKVYGRCKNPYVTTHTPGGSSGGQGCIIAAAGSVFGIGSDLAGSIRIPCFFNGIFGHLSTINMVPVDGNLPYVNDPLTDYLSIGPMCRYATDLLPIYKILAQNNLNKLKLDHQVDIKTLKIFYMEDDGGCTVTGRIHPELKTAMQKVITYFKQVHGIQAENVKIEELFYTYGILQTKIFQNMDPPIDELITDGQGALHFNKELAKWCIGCSRYTLPTLMNVVAFKMANDNVDYLNYMTSKFHALCERFQELLGENCIFLYPSHPRPAPYYCQPIFQSLNFLYTAIFNVTGLPVTQCPLGLGSQGLPLGIQVVAGQYNDHLTLAIAVELEKAFGGWVPPCPISPHEHSSSPVQTQLENCERYVNEMMV